MEGKCDAEERARSRSPKPRLGARETLTDPVLHHVTGTPLPLVPGCGRAHLLARRGGQEGGCSIKSRGAGGGTSVRTAEAGRQVGRGARARPAEGNGGKTRARARGGGGPVTACALGGWARAGRVLVRRRPWPRRGPRPRGSMARGWPPPQPAGRPARLPRPGLAPASRPSASPRTACGPAEADMASPGALPGPARWSALPRGRAGVGELLPSPGLPRAYPPASSAPCGWSACCWRCCDSAGDAASPTVGGLAI